jgi:light-regulated signal transduction histidine kinase (bacteriophytochrome)
MIDHRVQNTDQYDILIVDDTTDSLGLLNRILEARGYRVRAATNGRHSLKSVAAKLPDLILLDVKMPVMDGYEVCRRLKSDQHSRNVPVIFISALGETAKKVEGFKAGGVDYITKPFETEEVLARVEIHLQLHELTERMKQKVLEQTVELTGTNRQLRQEIEERRRAEQALEKHREHLEELVRGRTAQLEAANKEMHAFTYTVSHDLRAPLRHIDGYIGLLQNKTGTVFDEQGRHYMTAISEAAQKMGLLIDDLLSFSRMGRHTPSFRKVALEKLVHDILREFEPHTAGRKIDWRIGELPAVSGDEAMLRVVLVNLIANALKFTRLRQAAEIEIGSLPGKDSKVVIFVRDNGVGFDPAYADKLFGVFQRLHHADEFEGTGIGLANVHRIIARHGGRTWAEGKPDRGATFYFALPQT